MAYANIKATLASDIRKVWDTVTDLKDWSWRSRGHSTRVCPLFLTAAKYGSFTKTGEIMFLSQSWVSKRISFMERELGLQLFVRNNRKLTLTPAGRILAFRLEAVTDYILDALQEAHSAQKGAAGHKEFLCFYCSAAGLKCRIPILHPGKCAQSMDAGRGKTKNPAPAKGRNRTKRERDIRRSS